MLSTGIKFCRACLCAGIFGPGWRGRRAGPIDGSRSSLSIGSSFIFVGRAGCHRLKVIECRAVIPRHRLCSAVSPSFWGAEDNQVIAFAVEKAPLKRWPFGIAAVSRSHYGEGCPTPAWGALAISDASLRLHKSQRITPAS